ncbi:hypothetical protein V6N11_078992 [Hibiscus sabdariffa]|uniref:Rx N-terminal domain-containing protein n=1 Tax=Hibiscus sabdariffa TaxID=183260 RepID=A0ABR2RU22_9ROSI
MALSAVSSAVQTIGHVVAQEAIYLWGVEEQVDCLQSELKWMQIFLRKVDAKPALAKDEIIRLWAAEIRKLAYDAEDVIEDFTLRIGSRRSGGLSNCIERSACILKDGRMLHQTRSKIDKIFTRVTDLVRRLQAYGIKELREEDEASTSAERRESRRPYPHIIDDNIVGLDNDIKKLVSVIVDEESESRVISICGMGVILDDIWSIQAWDSIKPALPKETRTKFLLTSRNTEVVSHADSRGYLHMLQILNRDQSWDLFRKIAFSQVPAEEEDGNEGSILEDLAEGYLMELVERCMVQVRERDVANLKIKTVQMHDLMRNLCLSKAKQENFLCFVDESNASSISTVRRIHRVSAPNILWTKRIKSPNLRSFLFFGEISDESIKQMKLYRQPVFRKMINYLEDHEDRDEITCLQVSNTAFLLFFGWFPEIQGLYTYMFNNFKLLRVFSYEVKDPEPMGWKLSSDIGRIDPRHLNQLLSSCVSLCKLSLHVEISELPEYDYSSSNLAYLNLRTCKLEKDPMPTLEKLPSLRVLELHDEAFKGKEMSCSTQGFPKLETLTLYGLLNLEEWKVDDGAMPCLRRLEIKRCRQLKMVPDGLRYITRLQELEIKSMPKMFKENLVEGGEDFGKVRHVPSRIFKDCDK